MNNFKAMKNGKKTIVLVLTFIMMVTVMIPLGVAADDEDLTTSSAINESGLESETATEETQAADETPLLNEDTEDTVLAEDVEEAVLAEDVEEAESEAAKVEASTPDDVKIPDKGELKLGTLSDPNDGVINQAELLSAITAAPAGTETEIVIAEDFALSSTVTIPAGKNIKLISEGGSNLTLSPSTTGLAHLDVKGELTIQNVNITGNTINGGISVSANGTLTLKSGIISACRVGLSGDYGTGAIKIKYGTFVMDGGKITENSVVGVFVMPNNGNSYFTMNDGEISNNTGSWGGGIQLSGDSTYYKEVYVTINGGKITGNTASSVGGGIGADGLKLHLSITGGEISNNRALGTPTSSSGSQYVGSGGGIFVTCQTEVSISGCSIIGNSSVNGDGGGIALFVANPYDCAGLTITDTIISDNTAARDGGGISVVASGGSYGTNRYAYFAAMTNSYYPSSTATTNHYLTTSDTVYFSGNKAATLVVPNLNQSWIKYGSTSVTGRTSDWPMDNYDISNNYNSPAQQTARTVNYYLDGAKLGALSKIVVNGTKLTKPEDPAVADGYILDSWYKDNSYANSWNFDSDTVNANTDIYSKSVLKDYNIDYILNGGIYKDAPTGFTVESDDITLGTPTKEGYTFDGWTKGGEKIVKIPTGTTGDLTLTAHWLINSSAVNYKVTEAPSGAPSAPASESVSYGTSKSVAPALTFAGYTFTGWTTSDVSVSAGKFTMPDKAVNFTGTWKINTYTVTFKNFNGKVLKSQTVNYGGDASAPANPTRKGYTFADWDNAFKNITSDLTVTAQYTKDEVTPVMPPKETTPPVVPKTPAAVPPVVVPATVTAPETPEPAVVPDPVPTAPEEVTPAAEPVAGSLENDTNVVPEPETPDTTVFAGTPAARNAAVVQAARAEGIPVLGIGDGGVPLFGPNGTLTWALLDLLLAAAGVVVAALAIMFAVRRRKQERDDFIYENPNDDSAQRRRLLRAVSRIIGVALSIISVVIFILTQDMSLPMVLADTYTIVLAVILAAECVLVRVNGEKKNLNRQEQMA